MGVVHAAWVPAESGDLGGELLFWAEEPAGAPSAGDAGSMHPFALGLAPLRNLLVGLGVGGQLLPGAVSLLLPSADERPIPDGAPADGARPRPWRVAGLRAPLALAAEWLVGVVAGSGGAAVPFGAPGAAPGRTLAAGAPAAAGGRHGAAPAGAVGLGGGPLGAGRLDGGAGRPQVGARRSEVGAGPNDVGAAGQAARLGDDLRFWGLAARFGGELLARELVVPGLGRRADGDFQSIWRPILTPAERRRLRALVDAMPPACRAVVADGVSEAVPAGELVEGFVGAVVDALARSWLAEAAWPEARWMSRQGMPSGPARWLESLSANRPAGARLAARRFGDLAPEVAAWSDAALGGRSASFRGALRLHPPRADDDRWRLDYLLQAADDPTVLIPAARVWRIDATVARLAGRRVVEPQELLLADLARAGREFAPIAASLTEPRPGGVDLTPEEAYAFLREAAPTLAEQGQAVLLPGWWTRGAARRRLGLRLALHPGPTDRVGEGGFGLQALVDYDWRVALGDELLTPAEFERLVEQKLPLVQIGGEWVELRPEDVERIVRFWREHPGAARGDGALSLAQALRLAASGDDQAPPVEIADATGWLEPLLEGARRLEELPEPSDFVGELRHYQRRGYAWLRFMRQLGLGACLADDMGLGKTIETIAALLDQKTPPVLIVCPTTVLGNWVRELARFAPGLRVLVHHGPGRAGEAEFAEAAAGHDVVLTTYALVHRDEALLGALTWATIVLDEAQNVKNPAARTSRAVRRLPTGHRVALTGTPVENRLGELWAIMEFLNPGFLGSAEGFRRRFSLPIERGGDAGRAEELRRLVGPFVLRRLKTDPNVIQDLPDKLELKTYPPLTREQASLYEAVVQDMLARIGDKEGVERRGLVLAALTKLKQVCNHPAHFLGEGGERTLAGRSGKLTRLEEMLEEAIAAGDHTLVFTQFAEWGGRLRAYLPERLGTEVLYLHGGTPAHERDRLVERFQQTDGPPVFVLSLRAGGTGLNLTRANRVIHYDRWWNPAVEAQATDRAFRIGQKRDVLVHAFVCAGTLEERIDELIESKRALAETVIGTGESWLTELSTAELREIVTLRQTVIADA
ncbi:MAG TPA: DEAD/DEAH box helicase [Chloroflexota bacterium]